MDKYMPRIVDDLIKEKMKLYGAVVIVGCKWCGKSTTCEQLSNSTIYFQDPDEYSNYKTIADTKPSLFLKGDKPLLIDEWQVFPQIWDAIRFDVDKSSEKGKYLLTGSATPLSLKNMPMHSGTGRFSKIFMRPMSLYESKESNGEVSLKSLFLGEDNIEAISKLDLTDYAYLLTRGGWPESIKSPVELSTTYASDYIKSITEVDINSIDNVEKNPEKVKSVLRSLARNVSTTANLSVLRGDIEVNYEDVSEKTIASYINALEQMYVIDDVSAWSPRLRSKATIRSSKKREFVDPSLAMASLGANVDDLLNDFNTYGFMFEALCIRDLKIYAQKLNGTVSYYRDNSGLECDAIVHLDSGKWGAIEIKLGGNEAQDEAAKNLLKISDIIDTNKMGSPSFLMILTATKYAFKRDDGVLVVPLGCLKD